MSTAFEIERLQVKGYRALFEVDIKLGRLNVVIGPNGVGKSSLLDLLALPGESLRRQEPLSKSLTRRGGLPRLLTAGKSESLEVAISARLQSSGAPDAGHGALEYQIALDLSGLGYVIRREVLTQDRGQSTPFIFIKRELNHLRIFDSRSKKLEEVDPGDFANELVLAEISRVLREAQAFRDALGSILVRNPATVFGSSPLRAPQTLEPTSLAVAPDGTNLFSVLYQLRHDHPSWYERILDVLKAAYPGLERLEFPSVAAGQVILTWYDSAFDGRHFYANELSSGTLRFLTLVTTLLSPIPPPVLLFDEPEESLHPDLIRLLAELMIEAVDRTQIIVATQSPELLRWLQPEHVIVADRADGVCRLTRADELDLDEWMKDYRLDALWHMGNLGGRP